jgi:hypothetical protein
MKIYQVVQKLLVGDIPTDWKFDKPTFIFTFISHPHKTKGKITVLYILIFMFLEGRWEDQKTLELKSLPNFLMNAILIS